MKCYLLNLNSTIKVSLSSKEHLVPPRRHLTRRAPTYILYFVTEGVLSIKLNDESFRMEKGDIYIFERGDMHAPQEDTDCRYFYLHFECDAESQELEENELLESVKERNRLFSSYNIMDLNRYEYMKAYIPKALHVEGRVFDYLENEFKKTRLGILDNGIERRLEISQAVASLFLKIERIAVDGYMSKQKEGYLQCLVVVKRIADYVEENYKKDISSDDIEKHFSLSYDYANRIFRRQMGMSIIAYRNHLRIEKAKVLLATTDKSVEQISDETGFGDKYYFSKFFKKTVGVSPTHFKRGEHFAF